MMHTDSDYFTRALHDARVMALAAEYRQKGYKIKKKPRLEPLVIKDLKLLPDLMLIKQGEKSILMDVKVGKGDETYYQKAKIIREWALQNDCRFKVLTVMPPVQRDIEIEWLASELYDYILNTDNEFTNSLAGGSLPFHVVLEGIDDVDIDSIIIHGDGTTASVALSGVLDSHLQNGSGEDRIDMEWGFPFSGDFILDLHEKKILSHENLEIISEVMG